MDPQAVKMTEDFGAWRGQILLGGLPCCGMGPSWPFSPFFAVPLGGPLLQASNRGLIVRSEETEPKPGIVYSLEKTT